MLPLDELARLQQHSSLFSVHPRVRGYLVDLVEATRNDPSIQLGASPRGMLHCQRIAQAWAVVNQRDFVTPSDIAHVARPVLSARLLTTNGDVDTAISKIMETVPAPEYR